jgi:hypothetical protein
VLAWIQSFKEGRIHLFVPDPMEKEVAFRTTAHEMARNTFRRASGEVFSKNSTLESPLPANRQYSLGNHHGKSSMRAGRSLLSVTRGCGRIPETRPRAWLNYDTRGKGNPSLIRHSPGINTSFS